MSLPQIEEIKDLKIDELAEEILKIRKEIFDFHLRRMTRQAFKPHSLKHKKHKLAQLLMYQKRISNG
jgi:large subunit ribosomal protein L29